MNIKIGFTVILYFLLTLQCYSQWPTSTRTDSALVINYGFEARVLTFDDGSSIFSHGVSNSVYLTKLDPYGYRIWPQIIVAHYNDSSDNSGGAQIVHDGSGGCILLWGDYRGADRDPNSGYYINNTFYLQRVDKNGNVKWTNGGVRVASPQSGGKGGVLLTDGAGGCIVVWNESGFGYPGAPGRANNKAARYNSNGQKLWEVTIDSSSLPAKLGARDATRAGKYVYIDYYWTGGNWDYRTRMIDTSGNVPVDSIWYGYFDNLSWRDSVLYSFSENPMKMRKIDREGSELWGTVFTRPGGCQGYLFRQTIMVPDEDGGIYLLYVCNDSIFHFTDWGNCYMVMFNGISLLGGIGASAFYDGHRGLVLANKNGIAQRYDSLGNPLWSSTPIIYQSDPENSYFEDFWGDNNGGIIATFWTTNRGLCAQHTGRFGMPGIVSVWDPQVMIPRHYELSQNYPNPFNSTTIIKYTVPKFDKVNIKLFDLLGKEVAKLVDEIKPPGTYSISLDANNISSGVYFYVLQVGSNNIITKRMVLIK